MSNSVLDTSQRGRRPILPTQREWGAVGLFAVVALVAFVIWRAAGSEVLGAVAVGLGASALSLLAAIKVVEGFRRASRRVPADGPAPKDEVKSGVGRQLKGADLRGANLVDARLTACDLVRARLDGANLSYALLDRALLVDARLGDAILRGASLRAADLRGADLTGADLSGAELRGANLAGARLDGADLRNSDLDGASFQGAYLRHVEIVGASTVGARFADADCRGVPELAGKSNTKEFRAPITDANLPLLSQRLMKIGSSAQSRIPRRHR